MDEEMKETLYQIVDMIDTLGTKVDKLEKRMGNLEERMDRMEERMDRMENDIKDIKEEQKKTNDRLDVQAAMWGTHEEVIQQLKAKKII